MKPDLATIIGFVYVGIVGFALTQGDGGLMLFVNIPSLLIVVGSLFIAMMKFEKASLLVPSKSLKCILIQSRGSEELITISVDLAESSKERDRGPGRPK